MIYTIDMLKYQIKTSSSWSPSPQTHQPHYTNTSNISDQSLIWPNGSSVIAPSSSKTISFSVSSLYDSGGYMIRSVVGCFMAGIWIRGFIEAEGGRGGSLGVGASFLLGLCSALWGRLFREVFIVIFLATSRKSIEKINDFSSTTNTPSPHSPQQA